MTEQAETTWVRCDREQFELEPSLPNFVRWVYPGELGAFGIADDQRDQFIVLVTNLAPGVRRRKVIPLANIRNAIEAYPGIPLLDKKEPTNGI